jgi:hypothetical protein
MLLEYLTIQPYYRACKLFSALWQQHEDSACSGATPVSTFQLSDASLVTPQRHWHALRNIFLVI